MSSKDASSPPKYHTFFIHVIQQQLERVELKFKRVFDRLERHANKIKNLWGGTNCKGLEVKKLERHVTPPINEFIDDNDDEGAKDRFRQPKNQMASGFCQGDQFSHRGEIWDFRYHNGLDKNLGSIEMKVPAFQGRNNPEAYLVWEKKIEFIFHYHNYMMVFAITSINKVDYLVGSTYIG